LKRTDFRLDLIIIFCLVIIPILIWWKLEPISIRFGSYFLILTSLGELSALVGTMLISLSMIFQLKLNMFFRYFLAKPTTLTNLHHYLGAYGLFLIISHPLFLVLRYLPDSPRLSVNQLFFSSLANETGLMALVLMIISLFGAFFLSRAFKYWKLLHQVVLISYLFILYHLVFVSSDISDNVLLRFYIIGFVLLGGLAFSWQKISGQLKTLSRNSDIPQN
jgi:predicted ferric reductase